MEFIHYGATEFLPDKFLPIKNKHPFVKPGRTGLWASPINSGYGWKDWCEDKEFRECSESNCFTFKLTDNARVYVIDTYKDLESVPYLIKDGDLYQTIDFEKMATEYDAIHLTINGQLETRLSFPLSLYGWDCESLLVLNPKVINQLKTA